MFIFFSMHICEHVKDEFPLLFAGDNKVFSDSDSVSDGLLMLINYIKLL